jgi:hypothetical protein
MILIKSYSSFINLIDFNFFNFSIAMLAKATAGES